MHSIKRKKRCNETQRSNTECRCHNFGLDDSIINDTKKCLEQYGYNKFVNALDVIKDISSFINNL